MEERKTYQPPLMTVSHVEVEEQLLGVSFHVLDIDNDVNAVGHEIGDEVDFEVTQSGTGLGAVGKDNSNDTWGITWTNGVN